MIHIKLTDKTAEIIVNSFPSGFTRPKEMEVKNKDMRYIREECDFGTIELLLKDEDRISNSNKVFKGFYCSVKEVLEQANRHQKVKAEEIADDYLHNIIKIHGNQKSIIERCVSVAEGQESYTKFIEKVKENMVDNPEVFAEDICDLSKQIRLIDYHIGGYNLLKETDSRISITNHNLKLFLLGLSHLFFEQFKQKNVVVSLYNVDDMVLCSFEYETFNIAMHSFFENAVKYSKPYSKISVDLKLPSSDLVFQMESIRIEKDEINKICERGFSGENVPEDIRGNGIGMYLLTKSLKKSNVSFFTSPDLSKSSEFDGIKYSVNTFTFHFPKESLKKM